MNGFVENLDLQTIAGYCTSVSAIIALVVLVVKPLRNKFMSWISKTSDKDGINAKIDNLTVLVEKQVEQSDKMSEELDKQSLALQCSLRNSILAIYNTRMKMGYMSLYERQNIDELLSKYKALGGNHFAEDCVNELKSLPVKNE